MISADPNKISSLIAEYKEFFMSFIKNPNLDSTIKNRVPTLIMNQAFASI